MEEQEVETLLDDLYKPLEEKHQVKLEELREQVQDLQHKMFDIECKLNIVLAETLMAPAFMRTALRDAFDIAQAVRLSK